MNLEHERPDILVESVVTQEGTERHDELEETGVEVTREEALEKIESGFPYEFTRWGFDEQLEDTRVLGITDFLRGAGWDLHLILDFKFSSYGRPFSDMVTQVKLYGLLADAFGFDTDKLCIGLAMFPRLSGSKGEVLNELEARGMMGHLSRKAREGRRTLIGHGDEKWNDTSGPFNLFLYRFDKEDALKDLRWALEYWQEERDPVPTGKAGKCKSCHYNAVGACSDAQAPAREGFQVEELEDGRVLVKR